MPAHNFFLHCDDCHHEVHFEGSMTKAHIGYPCPICDANMLTAADYKRGARVQWVLKLLQRLGLVRAASFDTRPGPGEAVLTIRGHNGRVHAKVEAGE